ncbi:MAG: SGNH/GDSL hydrolase family protein [bacterium]
MRQTRFAALCSIALAALASCTPIQQRGLDPLPAPVAATAASAPAAGPSTQQLVAWERERNDWPNLARYRAANAQLGDPAPGENRVVFMGNSITDGWAKRFATDFPGKPYVGRGISGQTTPQMLARFRQDVVALKPKVVVILAGINDIAGNTGPSTQAMIADNIMGMTDIAKANGIRVVLSSVLPAFDFPWRRGLEPAPKVIALNAWIKAYAQGAGVVYLDYHTKMADARGGLSPEMASDGVHPTVAGYQIMAPMADAAIAEALAKR